MTRDKFQAYEGVRRSGLTNMFMVISVIKLAEELFCVELTREEVFDIMKHYRSYKKQFISTL
jgi:hypothetical protein